MTQTTDTHPDPPPRPDYDSPWKEAIDAFFQPFMALFFPAVHDLIDWDRPYEFLDAELRQITADSAIGRRHADRLVRVMSREGHEVWLLLHIEIQGRAPTPASPSARHARPRSSPCCIVTAMNATRRGNYCASSTG